MLDEGLQVGRILDLGTAREASGVTGDHCGAIQHAHFGDARQHQERAAHVRMWDRVVVQIEAYVGRLVRTDRDPLVCGEGLDRKAQQARLFRLEAGLHAACAILRARPLCCFTGTPGERLRVQICKIGELASCEEAFAYEADGALHASLLVAPSDRDWTGLEAIPRSQFQQGGMEADRIATPFQHCALEVVIQTVPR